MSPKVTPKTRTWPRTAATRRENTGSTTPRRETGGMASKSLEATVRLAAKRAETLRSHSVSVHLDLAAIAFEPGALRKPVVLGRLFSSPDRPPSTEDSDESPRAPDETPPARNRFHAGRTLREADLEDEQREE